MARTSKPTPIVTKDSLREMLSSPNQEYVIQVVGRALVGIFERQTASEKSSNHTEVHNGIGFAGCDARSGTLTAKSFLKNKTLLDWQLAQWTRVGASGYPRLCKYSKQLNQIALEKRGASNDND